MSNVLNDDEVQALMGAMKEGRVSAEGEGVAKKNITPYDLTSQDRVVRGQMPTLDAINEHLASLLSIGWSTRTRLAVRVAAIPSTLLKFYDLQALMVPPATLCVVNLTALSSQALVVLEPGLADLLLASSLGDRRARQEELPPEPRRDLTAVERQVLRRLMTVMTEAMADTWAPVLAMQPEVSRFESDPRLAAVAAPTDPAVLCTFDVSGAFSGRAHLVLPFAIIEPVKKQLSSPLRTNAHGDARFANALALELGRVSVEIRAVLGTKALTLSDLLSLNAGDVLTLDAAEGTPAVALVEGRAKLLGQPCTQGGSLAIKVQTGPAYSVPSPFVSPDTWRN